MTMTATHPYVATPDDACGWVPTEDGLPDHGNGPCGLPASAHAPTDPLLEGTTSPPDYRTPGEVDADAEAAGALGLAELRYGADVAPVIARVDAAVATLVAIAMVPASVPPDRVAPVAIYVKDLIDTLVRVRGSLEVRMTVERTTVWRDPTNDDIWVFRGDRDREVPDPEDFMGALAAVAAARPEFTKLIRLAGVREPKFYHGILNELREMADAIGAADVVRVIDEHRKWRTGPAHLTKLVQHQRRRA